MLQRTKNPSKPVSSLMDTFFLGRASGHGLFEDRLAQVKRRFEIRFEGFHESNDVFMLNEEIDYDDGAQEERAWRIRMTPDETQASNRVSIECDDLVGLATGTVSATEMRLNYLYRLKLQGNRVVKVRMLDRMYLQADGSVINRATMRKFGIYLGDLVVVLNKNT